MFLSTRFSERHPPPRERISPVTASAPSSPVSATWAAATRSPITATRPSRSSGSSTAPTRPLPPELRLYEVTPDFHEALRRLKPDLVSIATYSDSHADYAVAAMRGRRPRLRREAARHHHRRRRARRREGARDRPQGRRRLHPAPPPVLAAADRRGPRPRAAPTSSASTSTSRAPARPGRRTRR